MTPYFEYHQAAGTAVGVIAHLPIFAKKLLMRLALTQEQVCVLCLTKTWHMHALILRPCTFCLSHFCVACIKSIVDTMPPFFIPVPF